MLRHRPTLPHILPGRNRCESGDSDDARIATILSHIRAMDDVEAESGMFRRFRDVSVRRAHRSLIAGRNIPVPARKLLHRVA
jgi:hypothetical protein